MPELYNKPALTFEQQLQKLEAYGMVIENQEAALKQLSSISYYRLSGYWYPFKLRDEQGNVTSQFEEGASFDQALELYEFDRQLRSLVLDAIERIEVAIRTQITYHMAHTYGAFAHADHRNFHPGFKHAEWLSKLEGEVSRSSDEFIRHFKIKYSGFPAVPVWMLTEVMSLGALSFFYKGLQNNQKSGVEDKKAVAQHFNIHHKRLGNWLHILTYIRNICAHHSRLWNRTLAIRPDQNKAVEWLSPVTPRNDRMFYILLMLRHLLRATGNGDIWADDVATLLEKNITVKRWRAAMGMPENWKGHPVWR
ncbi:MAG: Abi family protein [Gammaproteobacteria bacterium]|nr:Abi family protein [Gammaproteobacteria bacterium]MCF6260997.1 Abi family protein [Gammaproteobacteria bacterium]